jgi:hypothetical protein
LTIFFGFALIQGSVDKLNDRISKLDHELEAAKSSEILAKESEKRLSRLLKMAEEEKTNLQVRVDLS